MADSKGQEKSSETKIAQRKIAAVKNKPFLTLLLTSDAQIGKYPKYVHQWSQGMWAICTHYTIGTKKEAGRCQWHH